MFSDKDNISLLYMFSHKDQTDLLQRQSAIVCNYLKLFFFFLILWYIERIGS